MNTELEQIKQDMLLTLPDGMMKEKIQTINKNKKRPLGKFNPWAWWVEITRGCNLRCHFCPTRLFPEYDIEFMTMDTWISLLDVIQAVSPRCRLELCNAGEPTLHPEFLEFIAVARERCPNIQLLTYTNGTKIASGYLTYKDMFDAGLNMVFLDMYAPFEVHKEIAAASGFYWYYQDDKPKDAPNVFEYQNDPEVHVIMLAENPYNWSKRKLARGYLQTFLNDLDWTAARKFGLEPVTVPPVRRCDLANKFINVNHDGTFVFCCFDYLRHTTNYFGNIKNGIPDFINFWFGEYMQETRLKLFHKNRIDHEFCRLCKFTSIRCDIPYWNEELLKLSWTGTEWRSTAQ